MWMGRKGGKGDRTEWKRAEGAALWRRWELEAREQATEHGARKGTSGGAAGH